MDKFILKYLLKFFFLEIYTCSSQLKKFLDNFSNMAIILVNNYASQKSFYVSQVLEVLADETTYKHSSKIHWLVGYYDTRSEMKTSKVYSGTKTERHVLLSWFKDIVLRKRIF